MITRQDLPPALARRFRTGRPSLDFTHTGGDGPWAVFELLARPADVEHWLGLILGIERIDADPGDPAVARVVRGAIWRAAQARAAQRPLDPADLEAINATAAVSPLVPCLHGEGVPAHVQPASAEQALSTLARDAIDVLGGPLATRIRVCAAPDCGLLFVDASRPGRRRWCSMQRCGNLSKTRAYRRRDAATGS